MVESDIELVDLVRDQVRFLTGTSICVMHANQQQQQLQLQDFW